MRLDIARLREAREGHRIGIPLVYRETTGSTNDDAMELGRQGAEEGTTVIAEEQTRGRGRLGRQWVSPPEKNVYLSVILRPPIPARLAPQLGIVAGVGLVEAIRNWVPEAALKWPNDVLIAGRKVAGILVEMVAKGDDVDFAVVGIGVNGNMRIEEFPPELRDTAGSLAIALGRDVDRTELALAVLQHLEAEYETYLQHGFAPVRIRWLDRAAIVGKEIAVRHGNDEVRGVALGISDDGTLELRRADGQLVEILSGDVFLDERGGARN